MATKNQAGNEMNIKVEILESEIVADGDTHRRKAKKTKSKEDDARLIHIYDKMDGTTWCHVVRRDGQVEKHPITLIKVVDNAYLK
jgi:hypothetical protein